MLIRNAASLRGAGVRADHVGDVATRESVPEDGTQTAKRFGGVAQEAFEREDEYSEESVHDGRKSDQRKKVTSAGWVFAREEASGYFGFFVGSKTDLINDASVRKLVTEQMMQWSEMIDRHRKEEWELLKNQLNEQREGMDKIIEIVQAAQVKQLEAKYERLASEVKIR